MLVVRRDAQNTYVCRGAVITPGINIISDADERRVTSCPGFQGQVRAGRITIIKTDLKEKLPAVKPTGNRGLDAAAHIALLPAEKAAEVARGILDEDVLARLFECETRPEVLGAMREARNKIDKEAGNVSD